MAAGDWSAGAYIEIERGYLDQIAQGVSNSAQIEYSVVLVSGAKVFNGGQVSPFSFQIEGPLPTAAVDLPTAINAGGEMILTALAQFEGLPIRLGNGYTINVDGSITATS